MKKTIVVSIITLVIVFSTLFLYGTEIVAQEPYKDGVLGVNPVVEKTDPVPDPDWTGSHIFVEAVGGEGRDYLSSITQPRELMPLFAVAGAWDYYGVFDAFVAQFGISGALSWAKGIGDGSTGGTNVDNAISVIEASDQLGYVVTGELYLGTEGGGGGDLFIAKFNSAGTLAWGTTFGGNGWDRGLSVIEDHSHNFIVSGVTTSFGAGGWDVLIAKFDNNGNFDRAATLGGAGDEIGHSVIEAADASGNLNGYVVTGWTTSTSSGTMDILLAKFNNDLTLNTAFGANAYGGTGEDGEDVGDTVFGGKFGVLPYFGIGIVCTSDLFVTGYTTTFGAGKKDAFIAKFDLNGDLVWAMTLGGTSDDWGTGIAYTMPHPSVASLFMSLLISGFPSPMQLVITGATESFGAGGEDVLLAAFNLDGDLEWARTFGGTANDCGFAVKQALVESGGISLPAGRLFVAGVTASWGSGPQDALIATLDPYGYSSPLVNITQPEVFPFTPSERDTTTITATPISTGHTLTDNVFADYVYSLTSTLTVSPISHGLVEYTDVGSLDEDVLFSFAIITDNHIHTPPQHTQLDEVVEWINNNINNEKIAFVIDLGDITDETDPDGPGNDNLIRYNCNETILQNVKDELDQLTVPYIPVIGDHDVWYNSTEDMSNIYWDRPPVEIFNKVFSAQYNNFKVQLGIPDSSWDKPAPVAPDYFQNLAFDYEGYHFICLDFISRNDIGLDPNGWPDRNDVTGGTWPWFQDDLNRNAGGSENILIFAHHPLSYSDKWLSDGWIGVLPALPLAFNSGNYTTIVSYITLYKDNINMWFSGHLHIPLEEDITDDKTNNQGNPILQTVITTSVSPNVPSQMQSVMNQNPYAPAVRIVRVHGVSGGKGGCPVVAAYGTPMAKEIKILREFRDKYLLTNPVGQAFVDFYYKVSPPMSEFITEHPSLKPIVRAGLVPAVAMSYVTVNTTPAQKIAIVGLVVLVSVALAAWATRRRGGKAEVHSIPDGEIAY